MAVSPDRSVAEGVARGVLRLLADMDYAGMTEVTLRTGRRVDIMAIGPKGEICVVEIKSSLADFRADTKWEEYLDYCDSFYFAVPEAFPREVLPEDHGLIVADAFEAEVVRPSQSFKLAAARRKSLTLRFARVAATRLVSVSE